MKKKFLKFIPQKTGDKSAWCANYKTKIGTLGVNVGLSADEITGQQNSAQNIIDANNKVQQKKSELGEAVSSKKAAEQTDWQLIRNMANRIKTSTGYTEAIGRELGIVGSGIMLDYSTLRPTIKPTAYPGYISIAFNKQGMLGVSIYVRLKGTTGWEKIATDHTSPYADKRPLAEAGKPEIREYMAVYFDGREDVGQQSDIATIVFGG